MLATQSPQSNGGFRAEELGRRQFQKATVDTFKAQEQAIRETREKLRVTSELLADVSKRVDQHSMDFAALHGMLATFTLRSFLNRWRWVLFGR